MCLKSFIKLFQKHLKPMNRNNNVSIYKIHSLLGKVVYFTICKIILRHFSYTLKAFKGLCFALNY